MITRGQHGPTVRADQRREVYEPSGFDLALQPYLKIKPASRVPRRGAMPKRGVRYKWQKRRVSQIARVSRPVIEVQAAEPDVELMVGEKMPNPKSRADMAAYKWLIERGFRKLKGDRQCGE